MNRQSGSGSGSGKRQAAAASGSGKVFLQCSQWWCLGMGLGPIPSVMGSVTIDLHWWRCRCRGRCRLPLTLPLGVFIALGGAVQGVSIQGGLFPWRGSLSKGISSGGPLSREVSVWEVSVQGVSSGGSKGVPGTPLGSKFFHFHAVFGKKNRLVHRLRELAPPQENPGSATGLCLGEQPL